MPTPSYSLLFWIFLQLGCLSFGGPAAHLVFFHQRFVQQLKWLDESQYSQIVALAQLLPGPTSSQVGLAIGYLQKGYWGAVLAWLGFTLPSALFMALVAVLGHQYLDVLSSNSFHSIQLIVLAVVAWAFWQMLRSFCKTVWQYALMFASALFIYLMPLSFNQVLVILIAACFGIWMAKRAAPTAAQSSTNTTATDTHFTAAHLLKHRRYAVFWAVLFVAPFIVLSGLNWLQPQLLYAANLSFYKAASLVFGGGHVILPLLHQDFVSTGLVSKEQFDLGYAIAQLVPGPLFSFATYLGSLIPMTESMLLNATLATLAIFLPSFFLVFATLPYWSWLMQQAYIRHAVTGINAAVVGLLLYMVLEMAQRYILSITDLLFIVLVIGLLKSKLPVWLSLIGSFLIYTAFMHFIA